MTNQQEYFSELIEKVELVVIGASSGGLEVLITLLKALPREYTIPTVAVLHQRANRTSGVPAMLNNFTHLKVIEPEDKQRIEDGYFYVAPPNYHLFVERDRVFSLSVDAPLNYCRPSIDMLFDSAAAAYGQNLVGCVLTGANSDGAQGAKTIKEHGGLVYVQLPQEAAVDVMPLAAIKATPIDDVLDIEHLALHLSNLNHGSAVA